MLHKLSSRFSWVYKKDRRFLLDSFDHSLYRKAEIDRKKKKWVKYICRECARKRTKMRKIVIYEVDENFSPTDESTFKFNEEKHNHEIKPRNSNEKVSKYTSQMFHRSNCRAHPNSNFRQQTFTPDLNHHRHPEQHHPVQRHPVQRHHPPNISTQYLRHSTVNVESSKLSILHFDPSIHSDLSSTRTFVINIRVYEGESYSWNDIKLTDERSTTESFRLIHHEFDHDVDNSRLLRIWGLIPRNTTLRGRVDAMIDIFRSNSVSRLPERVRKENVLYIEHTNNQSNKKRRRNGIRNSESRILLINPSFGPLSGGTHVDILFTINESDHLDRLLERKNHSYSAFVSFGNRTAPIISLNRWEDVQHHGLDEHWRNMLKKEENCREISEKVEFVVTVKSPRGEIAGYVVVSLLNVPVKENGFMYYDEEKNENVSQSIPNDIMMFNDWSQDDVSIFEDTNLKSDGYVGEDEIEEDDMFREDIFGSTILFYAVARGDFRSVKLLLEKGSDPNHEDICGYRPIDVARYFKHTEIEKCLKRKITTTTTKEEEEEEENNCDRPINEEKEDQYAKNSISLNDWTFECKHGCKSEFIRRDGKLSHKCSGKSGEANHKDTPIEDFLVYHICLKKDGRSKDRHKVLDKDRFLNEGHCGVEGCVEPYLGKFLKLGGRVINRVGKRSFSVEGTLQ